MSDASQPNYCPGTDYRSLEVRWPSPSLTLTPTKTKLMVGYRIIPVIVGLPQPQIQALFVADKHEVGKPTHMVIPVAGCN